MKTLFFFFNDTATTEIYTLSLHDALPIFINDTVAYPSYVTVTPSGVNAHTWLASTSDVRALSKASSSTDRSEEHTSELQSRLHLVCRLLLEKKKMQKAIPIFRNDT